MFSLFSPLFGVVSPRTLSWPDYVMLAVYFSVSLAIGWFTSLVLGGAWSHKEVFWWPAFGASRPRAALLAPLPLLIFEDQVGGVGGDDPEFAGQLGHLILEFG